MQEHDWDDLRIFLALQRANSLSEAGRNMAISETTVARRLRRLEASLGAELLRKAASGKLELTDAGHAVLHHAEAVERENNALREKLGQMSKRLAGVVRISAVPIIASRILVPNLPLLTQNHPDLVVEIIPEPRNIDLTRREADLAIRFSRPAVGGLAIKSRKLGALEFGVFQAAATDGGSEEEPAWIEYEDAHSILPQARWTENLRKEQKGRAASLRVTDLEMALTAAACGLGRAILPRMAGSRDARLCAVSVPARAEKMIREVWLLSHPEQDVRLSVRVAKNWLTALPWA